MRERLEVRRRAYLASGQRPIPWVDALPHGEKMELLAELIAISLDLREVGSQRGPAGGAGRKRRKSPR